MKHPVTINSQGKMNTERGHQAFRLTKKMLAKSFIVNSQKDLDDQVKAFEIWNESAMDALEKILDRQV